LVVGNE
jgi:hypothetical protein